MTSPNKNSAVEEKIRSSVAGPLPINKYGGIVILIILAMILGQYFFKQPNPIHKDQTPTIETADINVIHVDLGGNESAAKLQLLPPPAVHVPSVLPPPDFASNAQQSQEEETRLKSPSLVFSADSGSDNVKGENNSNISNANLAFANQVSNDKITTVKARQQTNTKFKIFQGKTIPAVLETAVNSNLPGMVRAIINEDVYSETGTNVLLPKGTRLVGQYNSQLTMGQTRIYIVWTRAITPYNIDIAIGSPNTNALGEVGMDGLVDNHFWKVFGTSMLLSVLGATASEIGVRNGNSDVGVYGNPYQTAVTQGMLNSSNSVLQTNVNIQPTIHVAQGSIIKVLVARDLDFSSVSNS